LLIFFTHYTLKFITIMTNFYLTSIFYYAFMEKYSGFRDGCRSVSQMFTLKILREKKKESFCVVL